MLLGNCLFVQTYILVRSFRMILKDEWGDDRWRQPICYKAPGCIKTGELTYSMWPPGVKIDHSAHLQGIKMCWREWWLKCPSLLRTAAWKSVEWEFFSRLLLALCALDALLLPACMSGVWFAWGDNRRGNSLCPTFLFFLWADSVPLWQMCKCRVTLWPNVQRKNLLEVSVA